MVPPSTLFTQILQEENLASTDPAADWFPFLAFLPEGTPAKDRAISVTDYSGLPDGRILRTGEVIEHPGIQIRVRSRRYEEGYSKIKAIQTTMDAILRRLVQIKDDKGDVLETWLVVSASRTSGIMPMGYDPKGKTYHLSINYTVTVEQIN